jgi:hypothetical protein
LHRGNKSTVSAINPVNRVPTKPAVAESEIPAAPNQNRFERRAKQ